MYTKTQQKAGRVLDLYHQGKTVTQIIESEGPMSKKTVKKILGSFGIDYTVELAKKEAAKPAQVVTMYKEGKSLLEIETALQMTYTTVRDILATNGIEQRTLSQQTTIRHGYTLDDTVFDELTEEALYWVGFLYADGHIYSTRENTVSLGLCEADVDHMEKYKRFLKTDLPIKLKPNGKNRIAVLRFGSEKIHKLLQSYGFDGHKTFTGKPHELLKHHRAFWRGVFDGDGCIWAASDWSPHYGYRRIVTVCGTEATCDGLKEFVAENGIESRAVTRKTKGELTWSIAFEATIADRVASLLYDDATIYMERKYRTYKEQFGTVM